LACVLILSRIKLLHDGKEIFYHCTKEDRKSDEGI
jgi:hypothetical protein